MKISKIHISKYHQFEDFELELTYPKGHEKEGQPLDKVCFIGQSGTGKTTLLELIADTTRAGYKSSNAYIPNWKGIDKSSMWFSVNEKIKRRILLTASSAVKAINQDSIQIETAKTILHFPAGIANYGINNETYENGVEKVEETKLKYNTNAEINYYRFEISILESLWEKYYQKVKDYKKESINARLRLFEEEKGKEKWFFDNFRGAKKNRKRGSDKKRSEKMQELAILKDKVKQFSKEEIKNPSPENKELIEKYLRLADDLSDTWAITKHEKN